MGGVGAIVRCGLSIWHGEEMEGWLPRDDGRTVRESVDIPRGRKVGQSQCAPPLDVEVGASLAVYGDEFSE